MYFIEDRPTLIEKDEGYPKAEGRMVLVISYRRASAFIGGK